MGSNRLQRIALYLSGYSKKYATYLRQQFCLLFVSLSVLRCFPILASIDHKITPVDNFSIDGQAENIVRTVKSALKRNLFNISLSEFNNALARLLFDYRNIQHSSTGVPPSQLMFSGRPLTTRLEIIIIN